MASAAELLLQQAELRVFLRGKKKGNEKSSLFSFDFRLRLPPPTCSRSGHDFDLHVTAL